MEKINDYPCLYNLVESRFSCRQYTSTPVPRDIIVTILEAARKAPSACNRQPWEFLVIESDEQLRSVVIDSYGRDWLKTAPVFIVACGKHGEAWHRSYDGKDHTDVDVSIAVEHICLAATSLGLGSCWICNFDVDKLCKGLNIPEGIEPIAIIPIGYSAPSEELPSKNRKPIDEIVRWGKY